MIIVSALLCCWQNTRLDSKPKAEQIIIKMICLLICDLTLFPQPQPPLSGCRKQGKCPEEKEKFHSDQ